MSAALYSAGLLRYEMMWRGVAVSGVCVARFNRVMLCLCVVETVHAVLPACDARLVTMLVPCLRLLAG